MLCSGGDFFSSLDAPGSKTLFSYSLTKWRFSRTKEKGKSLFLSRRKTAWWLISATGVVAQVQTQTGLLGPGMRAHSRCLLHFMLVMLLCPQLCAAALLLGSRQMGTECMCVCVASLSGCLATNDSEGVLVWELKLRTEWQRRFGGVAWAKLSGREAKHTAEVGITPNLCNVLQREVLQPCLLCLLPWARFCSQEQGGKLGWSFYREANGRWWAVSKQPDSLIRCFSWVNLDRHPEGCTTCSLSVDPELHWIKRWNFSIQISCSNRNFATCWACFPHIYSNEVDGYKTVFSLFCLCGCYRKD